MLYSPACHFTFRVFVEGAPAVVHFHPLVLFTHAFVRVCLRHRCSPNASGSTNSRRGIVTLAAVPAPVLSVLSGRRTGRRHDRSEEITVGRLLVGTSCASRRCGQFGGAASLFQYLRRRVGAALKAKSESQHRQRFPQFAPAPSCTLVGGRLAVGCSALVADFLLRVSSVAGAREGPRGFARCPASCPQIQGGHEWNLGRALL
jgi:hypothetical protein